MRIFQRLTAATVTAATALSFLPGMTAAFYDVPDAYPYSTAINKFQKNGLLQGYSDGLFKPDQTINRAEFLKIVVGTLGNIDLVKDRNCFPDVNAEWFAPIVCGAKNEGIIAGYPDGLFHPERTINFVEASKIFSLAYKQQPQGGGSEWYEPYARALETSKAIPPSIAKLDASVTRGEMAEMMWRLSEGKTDQSTKGYLNVKYPEVAINLASDEPQTAKSCTDLKAFAEEAAATQTYYYGRGGVDMMMNEAMPAAAPAADSKALPLTGGSGGDYSQTNVQVEGVDEADIVKTDGSYLYIVHNYDKSTVRIVKVSPSNDLKEVASIVVTGSDPADGTTAQDLYIDGDKLIVISRRETYSIMPFMRDSAAKMIAPGEYYPGNYYKPRTDVQIYDVSTASNPKLVRRLSFDGSQITTRRIGNKLYVVMNDPVVWQGPVMPLEKDIMPNVEDSKTGKTTVVAPCSDVVILPHVIRPQYLTVAVVRTDNPTADVKSTVILGSAENVYSSLNNLYVANTDWQYNWNTVNPTSWEKTNIFRFAFSDDGVDMKVQGSVPGHILNQFSMDEHENSFRIATTVSQQWLGNEKTIPSKNNLYILNLSLEQAGSIEDIAPGEQIYSARFLGDRVYMVTFKTVDPLFVIDTSDPRKPKILGQLKIPGFSNYLHPYDEDHVIGFGKEVDESIDADKVHSDDAVYYTAIQGVKVSIFDVTDVSNPKEMHKVVIGDRGSDSPVLTNHKALLFEKDRNLLSFPILVTKRAAGQPVSTDASPVFQGAYVYDISLKDGFKFRGSMTDYDDSSVFEKAGSYWYNDSSDVERVVRVGSSLFTISQSGVRAYGETDVKQQGKMTFK